MFLRISSNGNCNTLNNGRKRSEFLFSPNHFNLKYNADNFALNQAKLLIRDTYITEGNTGKWKKSWCVGIVIKAYLFGRTGSNPISFWSSSIYCFFEVYQKMLISILPISVSLLNQFEYKWQIHISRLLQFKPSTKILFLFNKDAIQMKFTKKNLSHWITFHWSPPLSDFLVCNPKQYWRHTVMVTLQFCEYTHPENDVIRIHTAIYHACW